MRTINRLTPAKILTLSERGLYGDGNGLYLQVSVFGTKSWIYRYQRNGVSRSMGLGPCKPSSHAAARKSLTGARERAQDAAEQLASGIDPIDARQAENQTQRVASARSMTFAAATNAYFNTHGDAWDPKYRSDWRSMLDRYCIPIIGRLPVADIDTGLVTSCLEPIWNTKRVTSTRLRSHMESVLDYAKARGQRHGDNPARWKGHLENLLPNGDRATQHLAAMPYAGLPAFMAELRDRNEIPHRAIEFTILTASRSNKARTARWDDIDFANRLWNVPKQGKEKRGHVVPLSDRVMTILLSLPRLNEYVFPGEHGPIGEATMWSKLGKLRAGLTVHGFRSTFRDWVGDCTNFPRGVAEAALSHVVGNEVENAYRRGSAIEKRRALMQQFANFCANGTGGDNVV